jgi:hypothetical protein
MRTFLRYFVSNHTQPFAEQKVTFFFKCTKNCEIDNDPNTVQHWLNSIDGFSQDVHVHFKTHNINEAYIWLEKHQLLDFGTTIDTMCAYSSQSVNALAPYGEHLANLLQNSGIF